MLNSIREFYYCGTTIQRQFNKWHQLRDRVNQKRIQLTERYLNLSVLPITNGSKQLKAILSIADPEWMAKKYNNFYIYTTQIPTILSDCKNIFSVIQGGKEYINMFSYSSVAPVKEYITLPDDNDWLQFLPMGSNNYQDWKHIEPLTLWWHTSLEQTFDLFTTGNLRFHNTPPNLVFWILDIPTLVMKAVQFFKSGGVDIDLYLKDITSKITKQAEQHWYFKLKKEALKVALNRKTLDEILKAYNRAETTYSYIGPLIKEALEELIETYELVSKGILKPMAIFNINAYSQHTERDNWIFAFMLNSFNTKYNLSHFQQYKAMLLLRDIPYVDYIVDVYSLKPDGFDTQNFKRKFRVLVNKWKMDTPLSYIKNPNTQMYIKSYLNKWENFLNS